MATARPPAVLLNNVQCSVLMPFVRAAVHGSRLFERRAARTRGWRDRSQYRLHQEYHRLGCPFSIERQTLALEVRTSETPKGFSASPPVPTRIRDLNNGAGGWEETGRGLRSESLEPKWPQG